MIVNGCKDVVIVISDGWMQEHVKDVWEDIFIIDGCKLWLMNVNIFSMINEWMQVFGDINYW